MKPILSAVVIFVVSVIVLFALKILTGGSRATGIAFLNLWGITFMCVGVLYFVAGLVMRFAIR